MEKHEDEELLERLNDGEISVTRLLGSLRSQGVFGPTGLEISKSTIREIEKYLARQPRRFRSISQFLTFAESFALPIIPGLLGRSKKKALRERNNSSAFSLLETVDWLDADTLSGLPSEPVSFSSPAFAPLTDSQPEINTLSDAAVFIDRLKESEPALARLAVLRLFGGLRLAEVAARTATPLEVLQKDWGRLREQFSRLQQDRILPVLNLPIDDSVLRAIQKHPELLRTLDWRSFEKLLGSLLASQGFEVELQRGTKDGGVDIFAIKRDSAFGEHRYLVQAKRWSHRVGVEPVRELLFLQGHYRVSKGCLATTATFSSGAWSLANEYRWQLELRDFRGIQEWVNNALSMQSGQPSPCSGRRRR